MEIGKSTEGFPELVTPELTLTQVEISQGKMKLHTKGRSKGQNCGAAQCAKGSEITTFVLLDLM